MDGLCLQEDGLLQSMLAESQWLRHVLMRLAGDEAGQDREDDEQARESLAETVLLLVGTPASESQADCNYLLSLHVVPAPSNQDHSRTASTA